MGAAAGGGGGPGRPGRRRRWRAGGGRVCAMAPRCARWWDAGTVGKAHTVLGLLCQGASLCARPTNEPIAALCDTCVLAPAACRRVHQPRCFRELQQQWKHHCRPPGGGQAGATCAVGAGAVSAVRPNPARHALPLYPPARPRRQRHPHALARQRCYSRGVSATASAVAGQRADSQGGGGGSGSGGCSRRGGWWQ